jgi:chorismate mutase
MHRVIRAVRGAVGVGRNDRQEIYSAAARLVREILSRNRIVEDQIISILFSMTKDLTKGNPATGLRSSGFGDTPLFCLQEADIEGAEPGIVRVLVTYSAESDVPPVPVYLGRAAELRPDLAEPSEGEQRQ